MKRIGNLYNKVISVENLREADEKARKGKTNTYGVKVTTKIVKQIFLLFMKHC